jgi:hypothetical protein
MQHKLVSFPSLHAETSELRLNEDLSRKPPNLDAETLELGLNEELHQKPPNMDVENFGKCYHVIM